MSLIKNKVLFILILCLAFSVILCGCSKNEEVVETLGDGNSDQETIAAEYGFGNSQGNIINGGNTAFDNDNGVTYFAQLAEDKGIYKLEGSNAKTLLVNDEAMYLNYANSNIYYVNASDNYKIYKYNLTNGEKTILSDDDADYLMYYNGVLYYKNNSSNGYIYSVKADGTERTQLNSTQADCINVVEDGIYYIDVDNGCSINKMALAGSENQIINEEYETQSIVYYMNEIYFSTQGGLFGKITLSDGEAMTNLRSFETNTMKFNVIAGTIYFARPEVVSTVKIWKTDGIKSYDIEETTLYTSSFKGGICGNELNTSNSPLYIYDTTNGIKLYTISTSETVDKQVTNLFDDDCFEFVGNNLLYILNGTLYNIDTSTMNSTVAVQNIGKAFDYENGNTYYVNGDGTGVFKKNSDSLREEQIFSGTIDASWMKVVGDSIYYKNPNDYQGQSGLYRLDLSTGTQTKIINKMSYDLSNLRMVGDYLVFLLPDSMWKQHICTYNTVDGSKKDLVADVEAITNSWTVDSFYDYNNEIYFLKEGKLCKTDFQGNVSPVYSINTMCGMDQGWVYYNSSSNKGELIRINLDNLSTESVGGIDNVLFVHNGVAYYLDKTTYALCAKSVNAVSYNEV